MVIDSSPRGATVAIGAEGEAEEVGTTPYRGRLPAGEHVVTLSKRGYRSHTTTIRVRKQRRVQRFKVQLSELVTGTVVVDVPAGSAAVGADVVVDGEAVGTAPGEFEVEVGPHVVEIVVRGQPKQEEWIEVTEGEPTRIAAAIAARTREADTDVDAHADKAGGKRRTDRDAGRGGAAARSRGAARAQWLAEAGMTFAGRHFGYGGAMQTPNLRPYDADFVPAVHVAVELYPVGRGFLRGLGAVGRYDRAVAVTSETSEGVPVDTAWTQFAAGARYRTRVSGATVGVGAAYGQIDVSFDPAALPADEAPSAGYKFVEFAVDGRADVGGVALFGGVAGLWVVDAGPTAARFRGASAFGAAAHAGVAVPVAPHLEARASVRYDRFALTFAAEPGDTHVADGATDHLYGLLLGAAFYY